jgi:hypothetical protein
MAQAVSRRPLTAEARVDPRSVHMRCSGRSGTGAGFFRKSLGGGGGSI